jgi:hypothetical protein
VAVGASRASQLRRRRCREEEEEDEEDEEEEAYVWTSWEVMGQEPAILATAYVPAYSSSSSEASCMRSLEMASSPLDE